MKIRIFTLAILAVALCGLTAMAQSETDKKSKLHAPDGLFNHLSVGIHTGISGSGIDVTMPVHRLITVRAGYSGMHFGDIKFKTISTVHASIMTIIILHLVSCNSLIHSCRSMEYRIVVFASSPIGVLRMIR